MTASAPRFKDIFLHRPFLLLWIGLLASSSGAFLFVIVLAARIFAETGSSLMASSVFAAQWLLPLVLSRLSGTICTSYRIRSVLVIGEVISAFVVVGSWLAVRTVSAALVRG